MIMICREAGKPGWESGEDGSEGPAHISHAIALAMRGMNIRTLVNGTDWEAREGALADLRNIGMGQDEIARQLRMLTAGRDKQFFPPEKVEQTIDWMRGEWDAQAPTAENEN